MPEDEIFVKKPDYFIAHPGSTRLKYTPVGRQVPSPIKNEGNGLDEFLMKAEVNDQNPEKFDLLRWSVHRSQSRVPEKRSFLKKFSETA